MIFITPVEVTPGSASAWVDVDVSAYVPAGATGIVLHFVETGGFNRAVGWRMNGSTDARTQQMGNDSHFWCGVGVDGSRIAEVNISSITGVDVWLVGYWTTDAVFFTNAVDKSMTATAAWTDVDISGDTGANTAIAAIFEIIQTTGTSSFGMRMNGSTDNRYSDTMPHIGFVVGVDGSEICEGKISTTNVDFFLVGYITANATFNTNATDISLGSTGAWTDLSTLPAGALGGFIEVAHGTNANYGLRVNGSSENILKTSRQFHGYGIVQADGSQIIEGQIANLDGDFFLIGYPTAAAGGANWLKQGYWWEMHRGGR